MIKENNIEDLNIKKTSFDFSSDIWTAEFKINYKNCDTYYTFTIDVFLDYEEEDIIEVGYVVGVGLNYIFVVDNIRNITFSREIFEDDTEEIGTLSHFSSHDQNVILNHINNVMNYHIEYYLDK